MKQLSLSAILTVLGMTAVIMASDPCTAVVFARSAREDAALESACAKLENWYGKSARDLSRAFGAPDEKVKENGTGRTLLHYQSLPGRTMDVVIENGTVVDINYGAVISRLVGGGGRRVKEEQERQRIAREKVQNARTLVGGFYRSDGASVNRQVVARSLVTYQLFASEEEAAPFIDRELAALAEADREAAERVRKQNERLEAWRVFDRTRRQAALQRAAENVTAGEQKNVRLQSDEE